MTGHTEASVPGSNVGARNFRLYLKIVYLLLVSPIFNKLHKWILSITVLPCILEVLTLSPWCLLAVFSLALFTSPYVIPLIILSLTFWWFWLQDLNFCSPSWPCGYSAAAKWSCVKRVGQWHVEELASWMKTWRGSSQESFSLTSKGFSCNFCLLSSGSFCEFILSYFENRCEIW